MPKYEIADGPSREELFDALRLRGEHRKVIFQIQVPTIGQVAVCVYVFGIVVSMPDDGNDNWTVSCKLFAIGGLRKSGSEVFAYNTESHFGKWTTPTELK